MAEKINIADLKTETYADKSLRAYNELIAKPDGMFGLGSAAAETAASAAALALKAVRLSGSEAPEAAHAEKELETLRTYFLHLLDEENKAKKPLEKRLAESEADDSELEAAYRTACCIIDEVFYMSIRTAETLNAVSDLICPCAARFASAAVHFARCAMETVRIQKAEYSTGMKEPVFARTTRREPEIAIESNAELFDGLIAKFEGMIK